MTAVQFPRLAPLPAVPSAEPNAARAEPGAGREPDPVEPGRVEAAPRVAAPNPPVLRQWKTVTDPPRV